VNGACIISHGKSNAKAIKNAIRVARQFVEKRVNEAISIEIHKDPVHSTEHPHKSVPVAAQ
jgi:glycerol-3-phosphate acyltransferase PlsX